MGKLLLISCVLVASASAAFFKPVPSFAQAASTADGATSAPAKVVARFVDAVRKGDAAAIKAACAKPVAERQAGFDRWAATLASTGPKLPADQLRPVTDSRIAGQFAVVRGGFGPKPYMRLREIDGAWRILGPGDVKAEYGFDAMAALNLSSLEKWADREWQGPAPAAAPDSPAAPARAGTATPPARPSAGGPGAPPALEPTTRPASRHATDVVLPVLVRDLPAAIKANRSAANQFADRLVDDLLDARDFEAARQLYLATRGGGQQMHVAGELLVYAPGGVNGAMGRQILEVSRSKPTQVGIMEGMAIGYARAGEVESALRLHRQLQEFWASATGMPLDRVLRFAPKSEFLAILRRPASEFDLPEAVRAATLLGEDTLATALIDEYREKAKGSASTKTKALRSAEVARCYAWIKQDKLDQARRDIDERFERESNAATKFEDRLRRESEADVARRTKVELGRAMAARLAIKGDPAGVGRLFPSDAPESNMLLRPEYLTLYAHLRAGDTATAEPILGKFEAEARKYPTCTAQAYGLAAHAHAASGRHELAVEYARKAVALAESLKDEGERLQSLTVFTASAVIGVDAVLRENGLVGTVFPVN
jgi:hypothetical protein